MFVNFVYDFLKFKTKIILRRKNLFTIFTNNNSDDDDPVVDLYNAMNTR